MPHTPDPATLFDHDTFTAVWPMGAAKVELEDGHPYFYGPFHSEDTAAAERAFPGRQATLAPWSDDPERGNLVLHPSTCSPQNCPLWPAPSPAQRPQ